MPVKRAPWYVVAGAVAGFAGVIGLHSRSAPAAALGQPSSGSGGSTPAPAPSATGQPAGGKPGTGSTVTGSALGVVERFGYGELAVRVTESHGQITAVAVPVLRTAEPMSTQISDEAFPMLKQEVLAAHGGRINAIGGATYTSEAYAASLQSALDKLNSTGG